jgi:hypothetical protein
MTIYYIYEIPRIKVGCTKDLYKRVVVNQKCPKGQYKILGAANNPQDASELEIEWQIKLGYKIDKTPYTTRLLAISNTNYSNIDYISSRIKAVANTDVKARGKKIAQSLRKIVLQYDLNGNFIKEWNSSQDVAAYYNCRYNVINKVCRENKKYLGFYWKYKEFLS